VSSGRELERADRPINMTGVQNFTLGTNGGTPTLADLRKLMAAVRDAGAPMTRCGWIASPRILTTIENYVDGTGKAARGLVGAPVRERDPLLVRLADGAQ